MALIKFQDWLANQDESSAFTRARREIALGLRTPVGMGSLHGHSTASPFETKSITKKVKDLKKKKKKKVKPIQMNKSVDSWLKEVDALEASVNKLKNLKSKSVLDAKKKDDKNKVAPKPTVPVKEPEKGKELEQEPNEKETDNSSDKTWKQNPPTKTSKSSKPA